MKIKEFCKKNMGIVILIGIVFAIAASIGLTCLLLGLIDEGTSEFPSFASSGEHSDMSVPEIIGSSDDTSEELEVDTTGDRPVITQVPTPDDSTSSTTESTPPKKNPTTSTPPKTQTPQETTSSEALPASPSTFGNATGNTWTCPDPSVHPQISRCMDEAHHNRLIGYYQEEQNSTPLKYPSGCCQTCGLPLSPTIGVPGTCYGQLINGEFTCNPTYE